MVCLGGVLFGDLLINFEYLLIVFFKICVFLLYYLLKDLIVGYDSIFIISCDSVLVNLFVGYFDGYLCKMGNKVEVLING